MGGRSLRNNPPPHYPGHVLKDEVCCRGVLHLPHGLTPVTTEEDQPTIQRENRSFTVLEHLGGRGLLDAGGSHLSRCTQQEWLFRGDGLVPLVSVTLRQEKGCWVRSTLYIYRRADGAGENTPLRWRRYGAV